MFKGNCQLDQDTGHLWDLTQMRFSVPSGCRHTEKLTPPKNKRAVIAGILSVRYNWMNPGDNTSAECKASWEMRLGLRQAEMYKSKWCVPNKCMAVPLWSSETCSSTQKIFQQNFLVITSLVTQTIYTHWMRPNKQTLWNSWLQQTQPKKEPPITISWLSPVSYNLSIYLVSDSQPALILNVCLPLSLRLHFLDSWSQNIRCSFWMIQD